MDRHTAITALTIAELLIASGAGSRLAAQSGVGNPGGGSKLSIVYRPAPDADGFFGCGGVVGLDVAATTCLQATPSQQIWSGLLELEPLRPLRVLGWSLPIVPEIGLRHQVPNPEYIYFAWNGDSSGEHYRANPQSSLLAAIGFDTRFAGGRQQWGDRTLLKIGGACLLTEAMDGSPIREGCRRLDLDNWFIKAFASRNLRSGTGSDRRAIGYGEVGLYYEMPDHDYASKYDQSSTVYVFNDDGLAVTIATARAFGILPLWALARVLAGWDLKLGGGGSYFEQTYRVYGAFGEALVTYTRGESLAITVGAKYGHAWSPSGDFREDSRYWLGQSYIEWRPLFSLFR